MEDPRRIESEASGSGTIVLPRTAIGRWGTAVTALAVLSLLVILPTITSLFRAAYPWTDSWIMPVIGIAVLDVAAVLNAFALFRARDRSVLGILATILSIGGGMFATLMVVGEGIAGV